MHLLQELLLTVAFVVSGVSYLVSTLELHRSSICRILASLAVASIGVVIHDNTVLSGWVFMQQVGYLAQLQLVIISSCA